MLTEQQFLEQIQINRNIIYKVCNLYQDDASLRDDLFQEILFNAWKGIKNFKGEAKFSTWLYRVALNTAISFYKKEQRQIKTILAGTVINNATIQHYEEDDIKIMELAISKLSKIDKALTMLYLDNYDYAEIAEIMGISINNVAVKINRIKTRLKQIATQIKNNDSIR
jgi:RNA polymerase sigma factor (sigma-70 family)